MDETKFNININESVKLNLTPVSQILFITFYFDQSIISQVQLIKHKDKNKLAVL